VYAHLHLYVFLCAHVYAQEGMHECTCVRVNIDKYCVQSFPIFAFNILAMYAQMLELFIPSSNEKDLNIERVLEGETARITGIVLF